jgi:hypothetical protein
MSHCNADEPNRMPAADSMSIDDSLAPLASSSARFCSSSVLYLNITASCRKGKIDKFKRSQSGRKGKIGDLQLYDVQGTSARLASCDQVPTAARVNGVGWGGVGVGAHRSSTCVE